MFFSKKKTQMFFLNCITSIRKCIRKSLLLGNKYILLSRWFRAGFSAVGLFLGRKSKISHEQNVKEFQFYIRMPNFRLLGSIIKKKYPKVVDPLKGSDYDNMVLYVK